VETKPATKRIGERKGGKAAQRRYSEEKKKGGKKRGIGRRVTCGVHKIPESKAGKVRMQGTDARSLRKEERSKR